MIHSDFDAWVLTPNQRTQASAQLRSIAQGIVSTYIELELTTPRPRRDLIVAIPRQHAPYLRAAAQRAKSLEHGTAQSHAWSSIETFACAWAEKLGPMASAPLVWLEFDDVRESQRSAPSLHFCVVDDYRRWNGDRPLDAPFDQLARMHTGLDLLLGEDRFRTNALDAFMRGLPEDARVIHASAMLGRDARPVKLYVSLPETALKPWLTRMGFGTAVQTLVRDYCPGKRTGGFLFLDVDLEAFTRGSFGVVFSQFQLRRAEESARNRAPLIRRLVDDALCSEDLAQKLMRWPVGTLGQPSRILDLKLVFHPQRGLSAKAYLGIAGPPG